MGLLGGFKGKLIGKTRKEKNRPSHVVCVKFNTFSEFDSGPSASTSNGDLGRNEVVRERRPLPKPEIKSVFEPKANGDVAPPPPPPTRSTTGATTKSPTNATLPTNATPPTKFPTVPTNATVPTKSTTSATKTPTSAIPPTKSSTNPTPPTNATPPKKSTAAPKPPSAKATKSQAPKVPTPVPVKKPEVDDTKIETITAPTPIVVTKTLQFPLEPSDSDDDDNGNFQIHFSKVKVNQNFGDSFDEETPSEDEEVDLGHLNFSSQATSIFFGEEEEPQLMRPRHVAINDDDDELSDGSSASA